MPPAESRKLRIAFVVHDYSRHGGHARYTAELATRFKRDHEVHVFANTFHDPDPSGITYHHIPAWRRNALSTILSFIVPGTLLVRGPFDIIHAQGLCGLRHNVATAHFCQPGWYDALARLNGRLTWPQWLSRTLITPLERLALAKRSTRRVIAVSKSVSDDLARYYHRPNGVEVIYHGVDLETFHPRNRERYRDPVRAELNAAPHECLVLFVGNLQKGAVAAIRAVARVPGTRLVFVSGSDSQKEREAARAEGVTDRVVFQPFSKDVQRYFAAADVFVFPTLYEPYGMVISEAMAAGVPVVTSRVAGAAELVTHGVDGWLTDEPWAVDQIAEGLRTLATNPALCQEMGRAARTMIEAYTWDRVAAETLAVYREVTAEGGR